EPPSIRQRPSTTSTPEAADGSIQCRRRREHEEATMPQEVTRERRQQLVDGGAQLVEVLPATEYEEDHLPGAINLPLRRLEKTALNVLEPTRPVLDYCWEQALVLH